MECLPIDEVVLKIDNYLESTLMDDFGSFIVLNESADSYNRIYGFGCNDCFKDGIETGYEVGFTEGVRNNAETIKVKKEKVDDKTLNLIIGLSSAVLLSGFVVLCLTKIKKRRRK